MLGSERRMPRYLEHLAVGEVAHDSRCGGVRARGNQSKLFLVSFKEGSNDRGGRRSRAAERRRRRQTEDMI
jgi:hypothetical protein